MSGRVRQSATHIFRLPEPRFREVSAWEVVVEQYIAMVVLLDGEPRQVPPQPARVGSAHPAKIIPCRLSRI